jgi:hypothetical protein
MLENVEGYLKKMKSSGMKRQLGAYNMRYFITDFENKLFGYKVHHNDKVFKDFHKFNEIVDFQIIKNKTNTEIIKEAEWNVTVGINTLSKGYIVCFRNKLDMIPWYVAFNIILKRSSESYPAIKSSVFDLAFSSFVKGFEGNCETRSSQYSKSKIGRTNELNLSKQLTSCTTNTESTIDYNEVKTKQLQSEGSNPEIITGVVLGSEFENDNKIIKKSVHYSKNNHSVEFDNYSENTNLFKNSNNVFPNKNIGRSSNSSNDSEKILQQLSNYNKAQFDTSIIGTSHLDFENSCNMDSPLNNSISKDADYLNDTKIMNTQIMDFDNSCVLDSQPHNNGFVKENIKGNSFETKMFHRLTTDELLASQLDSQNCNLAIEYKFDKISKSKKTN